MTNERAIDRGWAAGLALTSLLALGTGCTCGSTEMTATDPVTTTVRETPPEPVEPPVPSEFDPMEPVATLTPGGPAAVVQSPLADSPLAASVEVDLTIPASGNFRLDAVSVDTGLDPEMQLIRDGALVASDSDSGDGANAQIILVLAPGSYRVRVRDAGNRASAITVSLALLPPA